MNWKMLKKKRTRRSEKSIFVSVTKRNSNEFFSTKGWPLWLSLFLLLLSCSNKASDTRSSDANLLFQNQRIKEYEQRIYPEAIKKIENGDLVLRLGSDITSEMFRQMNTIDKSFSHCGIASIENDTVFVYHAIGGEFNPDQKIKRESIFSFGHPTDNKSLAIYRPKKTAANRQQIASGARALYLREIPFDMQFDYQTEDRLYCAEFVSKCIGRSLHDSSWLQFSSAGKLRYVAIDNLFLAPIMQEQIRWTY
jgi:hypothetical protein